MILAQLAGNNDTAVWAGATAFFLMFLGQIGKMIADWQKNKTQARKDELDRQQSMESEKQKLNTLQEIARSNSNIREGQIEQNGKLAEIMGTNDNHHTELIRCLQTTCHAQPVLVQQVNQQPKEIKP